jgi:ankyrin repeat protein
MTDNSAAKVDSFGRTDLHYAVVDREPDKVTALLAAGLDPNARDKNGWTPLHFAAQNQDPAAARQLIAHGARVDAVDEHGNPPLFKAVFNYRGDGATIVCLLDAGADPDLANSHGVSPRKLSHTIANYDSKGFFGESS